MPSFYKTDPPLSPKQTKKTIRTDLKQTNKPR